MAKGATRISDIQENVWTQAIGTAVVGLLLIGVSGIVYWLLNYLPVFSELPIAAKLPIALAPAIGAVIVLIAGWRSAQARTRNLARVAFPCPYCDRPNHFAEEPTEDFECDYCDRTVHFDEGKPIPVRVVKCPSCSTEHRVSVNLVAYLCDRCNRTIELKPDPKYRPMAPAHPLPAATDQMLQNYDVLLTAYDRRRENDLVFKLQNLLVVNLKEARQMLETATPRAPIIVLMDVPHRKAEAVRRQLQELGATITLRPTAAVPRGPAPRAR
jgi:ribosomal protein L7/L12